jgi:glycosyltransferase involved in cell wall biosynthesis
MANWKKGFAEVRLETPRAAKRTVSACLIVKNEEENLGRCLSSLLGAVDEIVVVDTGSTDRTVEIAKKYGARVGHFAWVNDFAAARNAALDLATGDWVLSIDADEWLANDEARAFVQSEVQKAGNVAFVPNIRLHSGNEYWGTTRLFPRVGSRWEYRVHEQVRHPRPNTVGVFDRRFLFHHDGYAGEIRYDKAERNFALLRAMRDEAAPGTREHTHALIYLARALKDPLSPEQVSEMESALKLAIGFDETSAQLLTYRLYRHWIQAAAFDEIDRVNEIAWELGARGPMNHYARAVRWYEDGNKYAATKALDDAERANDLVYVRKAFRSLFVDLRRMIGEMP